MAVKAKRATMMQATRASILPLAQAPGALPVAVGDQVVVGDQQLQGVVRYAGATKFAAGEWLGIELEKKAGKNNGSVKGEVYFECEPEYGIFVRPTAVMKLGDLSALSAGESTASGSPASLAPPSPTLEAPKEMKRKEERKSRALAAKELEPMSAERSKAQYELAEAMEEHDLPRLRRALPVAQNLGVAQEEIEGAKKILEYQANAAALTEVQRLHTSLANLRHKLQELEAQKVFAEMTRQRSVEEVQARARQAAADKLEKRLWSRLEPTISRLVQGATAKTQARLAAAKDRGQLFCSQCSKKFCREELAAEMKNEVAAELKAGISKEELQKPAAPVAPAAPDALARQMAKGTMSMCYSSVATRLLQTTSFEQLDADGDGKVTKAELAAALTDMKVEGNEAEAAKEQIIQMADKDGDGVISKEELQQAKADVAAAEQPQPAAPVAPAAPDASTTQMAKGTMSMCYASVATRLMQTKSFEQLDADGDGKVTKEELAAALTDMKVDGKEAEEAKEQIMQMADQDGDGVISSKELEEAKAKHVNGTAVPA
ncbi:unnamed protein product [Effrenium voratum]|uniref:Uncharacterized protein n=1 Tax=Effrenium voratum TaxID=2562239 RepID=A0AA36NCQ8_9DINO|nr:unnamed protein product [Effrenium voratum]